MNKLHTSSNKPDQRKPHRRRLFIIAAVLVFGIIGTIIMQQSQAAQFTTATEAEAGANAGNARPAQLAGASGNNAITFGGGPAGPAPAAPTKVRAFVGGNDIAVTWLPALDEEKKLITTYNVYRNGVKVATTAPNADNGNAFIGTQYIDKNVVGGQTYSYQIETLMDGVTVSAKTAAVSATHPTSSAPVPEVVLDGSIDTYAASHKAWINQYAVPALKTWYPKISQQLAYPDYTPPTTIRLASKAQATFNTDHGASTLVAYTSGTLVFNPGEINKKHSSGMSPTIGTMLHASTLHMMNLPTLKIPRWLYNGIASYAEYGIYNTTPWIDYSANMPQSDEYYTDGRYIAGLFLNWLQGKYDPNYIRKVVVAANKDQFNASFMTFSDGRNYDQAWSLWENEPEITSPLKNIGSGRCVDNEQSRLTSGNKIQLWACNGTAAQKISLITVVNEEENLLVVLGYCLQASATADNSPVLLAQCDRNNAMQRWKVTNLNTTTNANLTNVGANRCLVPAFGGTGDGTALVVANCNTSGSQGWYQPQ